MLSTPAEVGVDGCDPQTMDSWQPSGLWFAEQPDMPLFSGLGPVTIDAQCGSGIRVALSSTGSTTDVDYARLDADGLFWRLEQSFNDGEIQLIRAARVCRLDPDGSLFGHTVRCIIAGQEVDCRNDTFTMTPFGRIPGEPEASNMRLVGEHAGPDWEADLFNSNVRVRDGIAYFTRSTGGMRTIDVSDPAAPRDLGLFPAAGEESFNDVKLLPGPFVILASNGRGAVIVDVSDPSAPELVTAFTPTGQPNHGIHTLFVETVAGVTRAYLADGASELIGIFDVTDPQNPVRLSDQRPTAGNFAIHDLFVADSIVYANATSQGLQIRDTATTPSAPPLIGRADSVVGFSHSNWVTSIGGARYSITGDEGFGAHLQVVDVEPTSPTFTEAVGSFALRDQVSIHNIMAFGDRAYVAYYQDGVRVLDLSDPTNPVQIGHFNTWSEDNAPGAKFEGAGGIDVDLDVGLMYVADTPRGLLVLELP